MVLQGLVNYECVGYAKPLLLIKLIHNTWSSREHKLNFYQVWKGGDGHHPETDDCPGEVKTAERFTGRT